MAEIREKLILEDKFSEAFSRYIAQTDKAISKMEKLISTQSRMAASAGAAGSKLDGEGFNLDKIDQTGTAAGDALNKVWKYNDGISKASGGAASGLNKIASSLMKIAAAYAGVKTLETMVNVSDQITQTTARLNIMNDGLQTTAELNRMIYETARSTHASYLDTAAAIASMGANAGNAFSSNAELIAFMEQVNKQFKIGGASEAGKAAAMTQLTQAMASGTLRGEELNSILENAPGIARAIEKYMGIAEGSIKDAAEQGLVSANVVKNAIFYVADETNKKAAQIPVTFGEAWTDIISETVYKFQKVSDKMSGFLNSEKGMELLARVSNSIDLVIAAADRLVDFLISGAEWITDNWDLVTSVVAAVGIAMVGAAAVSAVSWAAANWQILAVVAGLALIIYSARQFGATWEQIGGAIGVVFEHIYTNAMNNFIIPVQRGLAMVGNFIGNTFGAVWELVSTLFTNIDEFPETLEKTFNRITGSIEIMSVDMAIGAVEQIRNIASALEKLVNLIPGVNLDFTTWADDLISDMESYQKKVEKASGSETYFNPMNYLNIGDEWQKGWETGSKYGSYLDDFDPEEFMEKFSNSFSNSYAGKEISNIANDTNEIKKSVSMAEEDMKMLADMAERQYINKINLTSQAPVITVTGANTGNTEQDRRNLADALKRILQEQAASSTVNAYAMP